MQLLNQVAKQLVLELLTRVVNLAAIALWILREPRVCKLTRMSPRALWRAHVTASRNVSSMFSRMPVWLFHDAPPMRNVVAGVDI